jgi:hypothetical protein
MDSAVQYAYLFDIGWFLLFTCVPMLLIAPWFWHEAGCGSKQVPGFRRRADTFIEGLLTKMSTH